MKTKIKMLALLIALIIASVIYAKKVSAQQNYVSFDVFYDQLSPYGQWVDYPNYGYVWIPDAGPDFVPYSTRGHWIMTDYGWTWMSDYNWGWAPFHYGRWDFDSFYGWFWVPDSEWGPAWVNWRSANGYYGWAPMEPGVSISVSFGRDYNYQNDHWIFVRDRYIGRSNINRYYVNRTDHDRIIRNSTVINNTYIDKGRNVTYVSGPAREDVQRATGRRVSSVTLRESDKPGQDLSSGRLNIYRPQVRRNDMGQKSVPSRVVKLNEVKRPSERMEGNQQRNANRTNYNRREIKSNTVTPQDNNNNSEASQQQNANRARNSRREKQSNTVDQSNKNRNEQPKKSRSERDKKRID